MVVSLWVLTIVSRPAGVPRHLDHMRGVEKNRLDISQNVRIQVSILASLPGLRTHINILFRVCLSLGCATCSQGDYEGSGFTFWNSSVISYKTKLLLSTLISSHRYVRIKGECGWSYKVDSASYKALWVLYSAFSAQSQDCKATICKSKALMHYLNLMGTGAFKIHHVSDCKEGHIYGNTLCEL